MIFENVTRDMKVYRDEIFGPVISVSPFDTIDEAQTWLTILSMVSQLLYGVKMLKKSYKCPGRSRLVVLGEYDIGW